MKSISRKALLCLPVVVALALAGPAGADDTGRIEIRGSLNDKPFLARFGRGVSVGGYIDMEFLADENGSTFDQHRFIPFVYAEVSDLVSVASEIEFEHGGAVAGDEETDGEIKLEFAHVDLKPSEALGFRAGVILSPLGRFNLTHDSPTNDLTDRPLMANRIIPTTLSESGFGVFGQAYPSDGSVLTYEAYLVNGFNEGILEGDGEVRIREGRGSTKADNNNARSVVGRAGFSPALGTDFGASVHHGRYTDQDHPSRNLTIVAFDGLVSRGPLEVLGEVAFASIDPIMEGHTDVVEEKQNGFYAQANYHFLPGAVKGLPNSVFTGVVRFDQVDFNSDLDGSRERRLTVGANFRPTEDTAVKLDVHRTWMAPAGSDTDGTGFDALRFSVTTYF